MSYYEEGDSLSTGTASQLTETNGWGDYALAEYEEELARKRPLGFAPWPREDADDGPQEPELPPKDGPSTKPLQIRGEL